MSTRKQQRKAKRARLHALEQRAPKLPAPKEATPPEWRQRDPEPWRFADLGLQHDPFIGPVPRYQEGVIIRIKRP